MARVKVCNSGHPNLPTEMFCLECGASLARAEVTETGDGGGEGAGEPPAASQPPRPGSERAPALTSREAPAARLVFEWGAESIGDRLAVGRDAAYSPLAARLEHFTTVSGRHAELHRTPGGIVLTQVGRTNPTYVDGRPLGPGEYATLGNGSQIAFSRALTATLRIE
jgi:hypothetical protein